MGLSGNTESGGKRADEGNWAVKVWSAKAFQGTLLMPGVTVPRTIFKPCSTPVLSRSSCFEAPWNFLSPLLVAGTGWAACVICVEYRELALGPSQTLESISHFNQMWLANRSFWKPKWNFAESWEIGPPEWCWFRMTEIVYVDRDPAKIMCPAPWTL